MEDLLGGNQWIDIDQFSERDFPTDPDIIQNDINNPNAIIKKGDVFGYNYDMNILHTSAFAQNEWNLAQFDAYYAAKLTYTQFSRFGHMKNGRAPLNSEGQGDVWYFTDPSVKAGVAYKIDGRNRIFANAVAETRAPLASNSYVSERIKDTRIDKLQSAKILSYDIGYSFSFPSVRGRVSAFQTHMLGTTDKLGYYDDEYRTFVNHILVNSNKIYQGIEAGVSVKLNSSFTISAAGTLADYHYTNNADGIKSFENGSSPDISSLARPNYTPDLGQKVMTQGLKIAAGPQLAGNITLDYFHPKMWFVDITLNYFNNNYLDFAPNRFTKTNYGNLPSTFYSKSNLAYIQEKTTDADGKFDNAAFNTLLADAAYKASFGLEKDESILWGNYGNVSAKLDENGKVESIEPSDTRQSLGTQEKLLGGFMLDFSIGKVIYLENRNSINFNLSASNILNNTSMVTGGYQQARLPLDDGAIDKANLNKFPSKYYYAWGMNVFFNVGYRF
jgi:hypothetical protein